MHPAAAITIPGVRLASLALLGAAAIVACSSARTGGGADASTGTSTSDSGAPPSDGGGGDATLQAPDSATEAGAGDAGADSALPGDAAGTDGATTDAGCSGPSDCPTGTACDLATGACSLACSPSRPCNGGCCHGATCVAGTDPTACAGSVMCTDCTGLSTGTACLGAGGCGCADAGDCPCPAGWTCSCGARSVCADAPDASDPIFAQWPIPNSPVDVEAGAPNPASFVDNGDGTVTDGVTGLMWQQAVTSTPYGWGSASTPGTAQSYCAALTTAGHTDWRLPTGIELVSIVDWSLVAPSIDPTYFPGTPGSFFWSAVPVGGTVSFAWYVDFGDGDINYADVTQTYNVRCVR